MNFFCQKFWSSTYFPLSHTWSSIMMRWFHQLNLFISFVTKHLKRPRWWDTFWIIMTETPWTCVECCFFSWLCLWCTFVIHLCLKSHLPQSCWGTWPQKGQFMNSFLWVLLLLDGLYCLPSWRLCKMQYLIWIKATLWLYEWIIQACCTKFQMNSLVLKWFKNIKKPVCPLIYFCTEGTVWEIHALGSVLYQKNKNTYELNL